MKKISIVGRNACGWPNLTKLSSGRVLCTYFNAPSHGLQEGDLVCSISDSKGGKWKKRSVVAERPKGGNRMHLAVGLANNGDLLCFSSGFFLKNEKLTAFSGHWLSRSKDQGKSWETDLSPHIPKLIRNTIPYGRIITLGGKKLAYASYRSNGKGNPSETWMILSDDDGFSWTKTFKLGSNDSNEAVLCQKGRETILAAVRTQGDHHVKLCEFSLERRQWREKGPLTLPMQHPADLTLISEDCLLLTYGIRNKGLMGIGARISMDGGLTWKSPWVIHQFGDKAGDVGYPSTVSVGKRGQLLTAFYTDFEPTMKKSPEGYRTLAMRWSLEDWLSLSDFKSIFASKTIE